MAASPIEFVNVRHEQVAAHAADGYARVTGRASVVLSHLSPGLTNAATGVANAALDCIPMVVIAGDVPSHYFGRHPHQEVNLHADGAQFEIYRPFVKRAWRVDRAELLPEIVDKAFLPRRERPARPGARRRADGRLLRNRSTRRCSPASTAARRRCTSRRSTTRRRWRSSPGSPTAERPVLLRRRRGAARRGERGAAAVRRPPGDPGGLQPDGQGSAQRRPSVGARA